MTMTAQEYALELRLEEWSKFYRDQKDYGIGFRSESPEQRAMRGGGVNNRCSPDNMEAEETEQWVKDLASISPTKRSWAEALREKYFSHYNITSSELGKRHNISGHAFNERVYNAKNYLIGRLHTKIMPMNENVFVFAKNLTRNRKII